MLLIAGLWSWAQDFPNGPVKLIVPFPPGGGTDILERPFSQKLSERWGQPVVIASRNVVQQLNLKIA